MACKRHHPKHDRDCPDCRSDKSREESGLKDPLKPGTPIHTAIFGS